MVPKVRDFADYFLSFGVLVIVFLN